MRHGMSGRKLGRTSAHRKSLFENLATALIRHEQIRTTLPKAKDLRRVVEPLITKARAGDLAARREVAKTIKDKTVLKKLFDEVAPLFKDRQGGYTRVLKHGFRKGDNAPMAIIQLTEQTEAASAAPVEATEAPAKAAAPKKAAAPAKKAASKAPAASKQPTAKKAAATPAAPKVPESTASKG